MAPTINETVGIHPLISGRWSPRSFDPDHVLNESELESMLEAARWAPSSQNSQPWRFIVGRRDDSHFKEILGCLAPVNRQWAHTASALICGVARLENADGKSLGWALYDVGQAFSYMTFQAYHDGLHTRQMAGFDQAAMRARFAVPEEYRPCVVMAVGKLGEPDDGAERNRLREDGQRVRESLNSLLLREGSPTLPW